MHTQRALHCKEISCLTDNPIKFQRANALKCQVVCLFNIQMLYRVGLTQQTRFIDAKLLLISQQSHLKNNAFYVR